MKKICSIYRSSRHEGMYLYVEKADALSRVPETLLQKFGKAEPAMTLVLTPERKLARADISKVLEALEADGFYLQLPPQPDASMRELRDRNSKLL